MADLPAFVRRPSTVFALPNPYLLCSSPTAFRLHHCRGSDLHSSRTVVLVRWSSKPESPSTRKGNQRCTSLVIGGVREGYGYRDWRSTWQLNDAVYPHPAPNTASIQVERRVLMGIAIEDLFHLPLADSLHAEWTVDAAELDAQCLDHWRVDVCGRMVMLAHAKM
ncbi:hypothetical protein D9613_010364 [Agrocybe pediades]|uniref:Uncharacterized protein n=1 Tax=Agrocybe pediades TaxID=84607 RepID=A0A8H4QFU1_9AGAR|nr:hypothetical protein D9613_010364 [Agrocybe pediades]